MVKKPDFITKNQVGVRTKVTRPYKWGPGVPSLAIQFDEIPKEEQRVRQTDQGVLTTEIGFHIMSENGVQALLVE